MAGGERGRDPEAVGARILDGAPDGEGDGRIADGVVELATGFGRWGSSNRWPSRVGLCALTLSKALVSASANVESG